MPDGPLADVGSGAGLPGVPLAIADPSRHWRLIEPRARRAAFLEEVVRTLELDCEVLTMTAVQASARLSGAHQLVVARALAPPAEALETIRPLVAHGGVAAIFVGESAQIPPEAEIWAPGVAILRTSTGPD